MTSTERTTLTAHPALAIAPVDERIFGGFLEHLGRAVYGGIYDPGSAHADEHGCRADVLDALRALRMTAMRYPGGNFVSGYHWRDGIGPTADRPTVREPAWKSIETNQFGTHEFLDLCERMDWTPMLAVNLGTGTPKEAADWVEYCTGSHRSDLTDLRRANGRDEPWNVPLWCLGNEMDGFWQLGHVPVDQYGVRAQQAAMQMRLVAPGMETIVCGSSTDGLDTYGHWDRRALEIVGNDAQHLSVHHYAGDHARNVEDYLAIGLDIDRKIGAADAVCRHVAATGKRRTRPWVCVDEWNVWYRTIGELDGGWQVAPPLLEEVYDLADALVVAQYLMAFLRHADVVKVANIAQVANVIAPLLTRGDDLLLQTTYHAFRMISDRRDGTSLRIGQDGPKVTSSHGNAPMVDAAIVADADALHLIAVNRSTTQTAPLDLHVPGVALGAVSSAELLTAAAPDAANTWEAPGTVVPVAFDGVRVDRDRASAEIPPHSLLAVTITR